MSGGDLPPRQQMIGMMYLVLLAMLAMNASKDLLNAFVMLEQGIDKTVANFAKANSGFYNTIEKAAASSKSYQKVLDQANEIKVKADEVIKLISDHKVALVSGGELKSVNDTAGVFKANFLDDKGIPLNKDNQDFGATFFLVLENGANGEALKKGIDEFRDLVIKTIDSDGDESNDYLVDRYNTLFDTSEKPDPNDESVITSFASRISEHLPLASVTANLSLYQSYIRNAEADVVGSIASTMDGEGMVVDKAKGLVQFESGYVLKGDSVKGDIFLAAYNSKSNPVVYIGTPDTNAFKKGGGQVVFPPGTPGKVPMIGESVKLNSSGGGKAVFQKYADQVGEGKLTGVIEVISAKGTFYYPYNSSYMVAEPSATVAATKMNVFYVGVDNPIAVSAPGANLDEIKPSGPVSFRPGKKPGEYIVRASKPMKQCMISVNKNDGTLLGKSEFRVKRLPDPVAEIMGVRGGLIKKSQLKAASYVKAAMDNFDFDLKVTVKSFDLTMNLKGDLRTLQSRNKNLTGEMKSLLQASKKGTKVYFENIKASMPDGSVRKLGSISLKVQ